MYGWTGSASAKGTSPRPLRDPSRGGNAPTHQRPRPGRSPRGPSPSAAAGAGESVPHPPGARLRGGPGVPAPHLGRPRPHLLHFLALNHPSLRTLDFGTSCPHSQPGDLPPESRSAGQEGGRAVSGQTGPKLPASSPARLEASRGVEKTSGGWGFCKGVPAGRRAPPQSEWPPQKRLLHKIGASGLANSGQHEAEPAGTTPGRTPDPRDPRAPAGTRS